MKKKKSQSRPQKADGGWRGIIKANRELLKIYLIFGVVLLGLFTIIMIKPVYYRAILPFNEFLARSSSWAINLLGGRESSWSESSVMATGFSINIAEGCNGIYALSIVIAGIVAFPAPWRPKSIGLILAIMLIMILNYVRILTLWYAGLAGSFLFEAMHLYLWEFVIIALGAAFWYWWYEKFVKARQVSN